MGRDPVAAGPPWTTEVQAWSPNHGGQRARTTGCVLHATHGRGGTLQAEFNGTVAWFQNPTSEVSAHIVIAANGDVALCVPVDVIAWHARAYNATHLGIEFVKRDPAVYQDVLTDQQYQSAAYWLVSMSKWFGFDLNAWTLPEHRSIQADKIDIGAGFDRARLMEWIGRYQHA